MFITLAVAMGTMSDIGQVLGSVSFRNIQEQPLIVRIIDSSFVVEAPLPQGVTPITDLRRVLALMRVENLNPELAAEDMTLDVRLVSREGILASMRIPVAQLLPKERRNIVVQFSVPADLTDVAAVESALSEPLIWRHVNPVPLPFVQPRPSTSPASDVAGLTLVAGTYAPSRTGGRVVGFRIPRAVATVTNPLDTEFPEMVVAAIAFDRDGRMVGGGEVRRPFAPLESTQVEFSIIGPEDLRDIAQVEITAAYPWLDLTPYECRP